jgi:hypothetical protein
LEKSSIRMNSAIRGYPKEQHELENNYGRVYGLARYLSITDDFNQIKLIDHWYTKDQ